MTNFYDKNRRKTIIVVGGANGLGRALALMYARSGWELAVLDLDAENGLKTVKQLTELGAAAEFHPLDVRDTAAWHDVVASLQQRWEHVDVLVNCAATLCVSETGDQALQTHQAIIDVTLNGTMFACESFVPWMKRHPDRPHIVNVASCASFLGMPWSSSYNAAKAGVVAYSETLYGELRPHGIGVTVACPGFFPSTLFANANYGSDALRRTVEHVVNKSEGTPEQVAAEIRQAVERNRLYLTTPWSVRKLWWLKRLAPTWFLHSIGDKSYRMLGRFSGPPDA